MVYYSCPSVPVELIKACGHVPCQPEPSVSVAVETEGLCAWASAFCDASRKADAVIFSSGCDQMRRISEVFALHEQIPVFMLNVPKTDGPAAEQMLIDEFHRLEEFLLSLSGGKLDRRLLIELMSSPRLEPSVASTRGLAFIGGPLFEKDRRQLYRVIEKSGLAVVFDGTETAWRSYRCFHDPQVLASNDVIDLLAISYLTMPAIWKRPAAPFFDWLTAQLKDAGASGAIIIRHPSCDYWKAAVYEINRQLGMPILTLESSEGGSFSPTVLSRLDAFLEQFE